MRACACESTSVFVCVCVYIMSFGGGYFSFSTLMLVFDYNHDFPFFPSFASLPHFKLSYYLLCVTVRVTSSLLYSVVKLLPTICHSRKWNKRTKCSRNMFCPSQPY